MTVAQRHVAQQYAGRGGPSGLADVLEVLLDKGLVIDAYVRVSLIGIELLTVDARVVVASVDTYLRFAEATNRLDLTGVGNAQTLGDLVSGDPPRRDRDDEQQGSDDGDQNGRDRRGILARTLGRDGGADDDDDDRDEPHAGDDLEPGDSEDERDDVRSDASDTDGSDEADAASDDERDERAGHDDGGEDDVGDEDDDEESGAGILSRIKQRGQAF